MISHLLIPARRPATYEKNGPDPYLVVGRLQTNCYILQSGGEALVIDPGDEPERILRLLEDIKAKPGLIIATHAHFDHVLG